jgi:sugar lactone lactonase YvrE
VPAHGGAAAQITRYGGYTAFESTDGKTLYYTLSNAGPEGLYARRLQDGEETQVVKDPVAARGLAVFSDGLYYLHQRGKIFEIRFQRFAGARVEVTRVIDGFVAPASGLAVSPDRKTFLFSRKVGLASDLMLIENFR